MCDNLFSTNSLHDVSIYLIKLILCFAVFFQFNTIYYYTSLFHSELVCCYHNISFSVFFNFRIYLEITIKKNYFFTFYRMTTFLVNQLAMVLKLTTEVISFNSKSQYRITKRFKLLKFCIKLEIRKIL